MPFTGDFAGLRALERNLRSLANPNGALAKQIGRSVSNQLRDVIKGEFATGIGPYGEWQRTARGKAALLSKKLPSDYGAAFADGVLTVTPSKAAWLDAQQEGHTFPPRAVADRTNVMRFDAKGRLVSAAKFNRLKFKKGAKTRGSVKFGKEHQVGRRELPARPIYPEEELPAKWVAAIERGLDEFVTKIDQASH